MGFFSWRCNGCGHSLREGPAEDWLSHAMVFGKNGEMVRGPYDGYGQVASAEIYNFGDFTMYHTACWTALGKPDGYTTKSARASDQGCFNYDLPLPLTKEDVGALYRDWVDRQDAMRLELRKNAAADVARLERNGERVPDWLKQLAMNGEP